MAPSTLPGCRLVTPPGRELRGEESHLSHPEDGRSSSDLMESKQTRAAKGHPPTGRKVPVPHMTQLQLSVTNPHRASTKSVPGRLRHWTPEEGAGR